MQVKDGRHRLGTLKASLRRYEQRHEMTSEEMQRLLVLQPERETAEIAKWMQAYCVLRRMGIK